MPNYRGGDSAISGSAAQAIRNISTGNTEGQRKREFQRRAALSAAQAILMGAGGAAEMYANSLEEKEYKRKLMKDAIARGSQKVGRRADNTWGGQASGGPDQGMYANPSEVGQFMDRVSTEALAKKGLSEIAKNEAAQAAPVTWGDGRKEFNPKGFETIDQNAQVLAGDIVTAKDLMKQGEDGDRLRNAAGRGIGGSLRVR